MIYTTARTPIIIPMHHGGGGDLDNQIVLSILIVTIILFLIAVWVGVFFQKRTLLDVLKCKDDEDYRKDYTWNIVLVGVCYVFFGIYFLFAMVWFVSTLIPESINN